MAANLGGVDLSFYMGHEDMSLGKLWTLDFSRRHLVHPLIKHAWHTDKDKPCVSFELPTDFSDHGQLLKVHESILDIVADDGDSLRWFAIMRNPLTMGFPTHYLYTGKKVVTNTPSDTLPHVVVVYPHKDNVGGRFLAPVCPHCQSAVCLALVWSDLFNNTKKMDNLPDNPAQMVVDYWGVIIDDFYFMQFDHESPFKTPLGKMEKVPDCAWTFIRHNLPEMVKGYRLANHQFKIVQMGIPTFKREKEPEPPEDTDDDDSTGVEKDTADQQSLSQDAENVGPKL